jgi:hypothetical protein
MLVTRLFIFSSPYDIMLIGGDIIVNLCKCGCGMPCDGLYVRGHNARGRILSEQHKEAIGKAHRGKIRTPEAHIESGLVECACGCGQYFEAKVYLKPWGYVRKRFITGHSSRTPENREKSRQLMTELSQKTTHPSGPAHPSFKTGMSKIRDRWVVSNYNGRHQIPLAQIVMEVSIGRELLPGETVHHINGIKDDDRPENLMLFPNNKEHIQWHWDHGTGPNKRKNKEAKSE